MNMKKILIALFIMNSTLPLSASSFEKTKKEIKSNDRELIEQATAGIKMIKIHVVYQLYSSHKKFTAKRATKNRLVKYNY